MRDRPDFDTYAAERSSRLMRTAYLLCHDWDIAEDLVQKWIMTFTETDLRELLAERSAAVPSSGAGVPAEARRRGRRARTRRRVAGAGLTAFAVAATAFLVPHVAGRTGDGPGRPVPGIPAGRPTPSPAGRPTPSPAVDVSPFRGQETSDTYRDTPKALAALSKAVVSGEYEDVTVGPGTEGPGGMTLRAVVLRVHVDTWVKGGGRYGRASRVYVLVGGGSGSKAALLARYRAAVPKGTPLVAFLHDDVNTAVGRPGGAYPKGGVLLVPHNQGLIFQDTAPDGPRLVGALAELKEQGPAWNRARTVEQLVRELGP